MPKGLLLLAILLLSYYAVTACGNEYHVLLNGRKFMTSSFDFDDRYDLSDPEQIKEFKENLLKLDSIWKNTNNIEAYSDYGLTLMYLGRYKEAKNVFIAIEKIQPDLYATAANLGTVYDLQNKNDSAYYWINKAIKINPESHEGSEWLHLKILDVKRKGMSYLNSQFMIGTDLGNDSIPKSSLSRQKLGILRNHIFYQLSERTTFVKDPEPIIAFLLFQLGNIKAITNDITTALQTYNEAYYYGFKSDLFVKRYSKFKQIHKRIPIHGKVLTDKELLSLVTNTGTISVRASDTITSVIVAKKNTISKNTEPVSNDNQISKSSYSYLIPIAMLASLLIGYFIFRNRL